MATACSRRWPRRRPHSLARLASRSARGRLPRLEIPAPLDAAVIRARDRRALPARRARRRQAHRHSRARRARLSARRSRPTRRASSRFRPWPDYPRSHYTDGDQRASLPAAARRESRRSPASSICAASSRCWRSSSCAVTPSQQGLLLDTSGYVVGGTSSNVFAVRGTDAADAVDSRAAESKA